MTQTLSVRMDSKIKKDFDQWCKSVGMNASTAVNMFAKAVLRERKLPFEVKDDEDPFYSESNMAHLRQSIEELNKGKVVAKSIEELEKMENG